MHVPGDITALQSRPFAYRDEPTPARTVDESAETATIEPRVGGQFEATLIAPRRGSRDGQRDAQLPLGNNASVEQDRTAEDEASASVSAADALAADRRPESEGEATTSADSKAEVPRIFGRLQGAAAGFLAMHLVDFNAVARADAQVRGGSRGDPRIVVAANAYTAVVRGFVPRRLVARV